MASANGERGSGTPRPVSALPSVQARLLAFVAILVGGICGGLIGFSTVKVGCQGPRTTATTVVKNCATPEGVGGLVGALFAAIGVAVIAVLVLRAMGEWRSIKERRQLELLIAAAAAAISPNAPEAGTREAAAPQREPEPLPQPRAPDDEAPADVSPPGDPKSGSGPVAT